MVGTISNWEPGRCYDNLRYNAQNSRDKIMFDFSFIFFSTVIELELQYKLCFRLGWDRIELKGEFCTRRRISHLMIITNTVLIFFLQLYLIVKVIQIYCTETEPLQFIGLILLNH
jgi:hypothetical protein